MTIYRSFIFGPRNWSAEKVSSRAVLQPAVKRINPAMTMKRERLVEINTFVPPEFSV
jgi:hypothetical protein